MSVNGLAGVLIRMKQVTASSTDSALSNALGVSPQTLSSWKMRDSVPYSICVDLAAKHGLSLDWLLLGEGQPLRQPPPSADAGEWEAQLLAQLRQLDPADRHAIALAVQDKQRLRALEQQVEDMNQHLQRNC